MPVSSPAPEPAREPAPPGGAADESAAESAALTTTISGHFRAHMAQEQQHVLEHEAGASPLAVEPLTPPLRIFCAENPEWNVRRGG